MHEIGGIVFARENFEKNPAQQEENFLFLLFLISLCPTHSRDRKGERQQQHCLLLHSHTSVSPLYFCVCVCACACACAAKDGSFSPLFSFRFLFTKTMSIRSVKSILTGKKPLIPSMSLRKKQSMPPVVGKPEDQLPAVYGGAFPVLEGKSDVDLYQAMQRFHRKTAKKV